MKKYKVVICQKAGILNEEDSFDVDDVGILAQNDRYIVLSDSRFTKLDKKKDRTYNMNHVVDHPSISIYNNDSCYGSGVDYTLYTEKNKRTSTIKKEIKIAIQDKYGWLVNDIDFSFMDKEKNEQ